MEDLKIWDAWRVQLGHVQVPEVDGAMLCLCVGTERLGALRPLKRLTVRKADAQVAWCFQVDAREGLMLMVFDRGKHIGEKARIALVCAHM